MANQVNLGELVVVIRGDTKQMEAAAKRVADALKQAEHNVKSSGTRIEGSIQGMVTRFVGLAAVLQTVRMAVNNFQHTMGDVSALDKVSQATGIAIERLDSLKQAAAMHGVQWEQLSQVVTQFSARLREFSQNDVSAGAQAFRALGIRIRDSQGNLRSIDSLLPQLADAFAKYGDGANKAAIASALFGEQGGPQMTRFLNQGSQAIARQRLEIEQQGRVVTREGVEKARQYERVMAELNSAVDALSRDFAMMLAPSIITAAKAINEFFNSMRMGSSTSIEQLNTRMAELQAREEKLKTDLADPGFWGAFANAAGARTELENIRKEMDAIAERQANLRGGFTTTVTVEQNNRPNAPGLPNQQALERFNELKALGKQLTLEMMTAQEALNKVERDYAAALAQGSISRETYNRAIRDASVQYNESQNALAASLGVTFTANETMLQQQARIEEAFRRGGISAEMYGRAMQNASVTSAANMTALAQQLGSTLTTVFAKSKAAAIASGIINTAVGVTQALRTYPPPLSFAMAGLQAAAGAAQIAAIRSTSETGGGSVPAPSAAAASSAAPAQQSTLFVSGINPNDIFTGQHMRQLASSMIDFQKQGGKIVLGQT